MKQIISLFLIFSTIGCSRSNLTVDIENSETGTAYLLNTITNKIDTIEYKDYHFKFYDKLNNPTLFHLYFKEIKNRNRPIYLILSKKTTEIKFDSLVPSKEFATSWSGLYPNRPIFVKDPNQNESFYRFQSLWISFSDSILSMSSNENKKEALKKNRQNLYNDFITKCGVIISENKDRLISAFILEYLMNNNLLELSKIQEYYSILDTAVQRSDIGSRIGMESGLKLRTEAPDFEIIDMKGNHYDLEKLKGKKILLHFWSTTCAPCIKEIPLLLKLDNNKNDLTIINISLDTDRDRWEKGVSKLGMDNTINFCDFKGTNGKITKDYYIKAIPANYLISEQGKIIAKRQNIQEIIEDLKHDRPIE